VSNFLELLTTVVVVLVVPVVVVVLVVPVVVVVLVVPVVVPVDVILIVFFRCKMQTQKKLGCLSG